MPKPRPGEKVVLVFREEPIKRYEIIHLNKYGLKISRVLNGKFNRNELINEYRIGKDRPGGYFIVKSHNVQGRGRDFLVLPEESQVEEELYKRVLEKAQEYAEEELPFEDKSNFQSNSHFYEPLLF